MTGANYTGGKRHIARTRFRDSTGRAQKNHFGRRRLGILSRSLANGIHSREEEGEPTPGLSGILLEHAQKEISRLPKSILGHQTGALDAFTFDPSSPTRSSIRTGLDVVPSNLRGTSIPYDGSYSSLRADANRVLEFSKTVGLCNYATSPKQGVTSSPVSPLNSEPGVGIVPPVSRSLTRTLQQLEPPQKRSVNLTSPTSGSSGRPHPESLIGYAAQSSEFSRKSRTGTPQLNLLREAGLASEQTHVSETDLVKDEPTSDYENLKYCASPSHVQSIVAVEPQLVQDNGSPGSWRAYPTDPLCPSFDALEFPTSPLPPSSPVPSSTAYGPLPSRCQMSHEAETTTLDFDGILLPSAMSDSCEAGSSSRYGDSRDITTPDLASMSPSRHSGLAHNVLRLSASPSKADLIPNLLACSDPWNVIGDVLDLPPIPSADATYLSNIRPFRLLASSSSLGQLDIGEHSSTARGEGAWLKAVQSDGGLFIRHDPSRLGEAPRSIASPLLCWDSPTEQDLTRARRLRPSREAHPLDYVDEIPESHWHSPSPPTSGKFPVLSETPQCMLGPRALPALPQSGASGIGQDGSLVLIKTPSSNSMPQRSTSPPPKDLKPLRTPLSLSPPRVMSTQRDAITDFDLVALFPKIPATKSATSRVLPLKLECPNLFQEDGLGV